MRETPSLFDIDYAAARNMLVKAAAKGRKSKISGWQFTEGFQSYKKGLPLRHCMKAAVFQDSQQLWRTGWLTAMFIDLNNRESIVMSKEVKDAVPE